MKLIFITLQNTGYISFLKCCMIHKNNIPFFLFLGNGHIFLKE